jgi:hypothetical protein
MKVVHSSTRFPVSIAKPLLLSLRPRRALSRTSEPALLAGASSDAVWPDPFYQPGFEQKFYTLRRNILEMESEAEAERAD